MISLLLALGVSCAVARAAEPAQLAAMVCGSCHTLDVVARKQAALDRGRAKDLVESVCVLCHEFTRVQRAELTRDEWAGVIKGMLAEGAPLTDEEFSIVIDYLAKTYGVKQEQ